jgi:SAM-dependent methyltransferase
MTTKTAEEIKEEVRHAYGQAASRFVETQARASCCEPAAKTSCCDPVEAEEVEAISAARLYSEGELTDLPESVTGASMGCGNPTAIASLKPGDVVLDLGSGGGIDCFLAAKQVGPTGKVIGLDMTPEMIQLARRNAKKVGATNVDFRYGEMEEMPLSDASVDAIISNCVINLSLDKDAVFAEAFRVLKPGGRVSVSDIVTNGELPEAVRGGVMAWAGCVAGALDEEDYLDKMRAAGLTDVAVTQRVYINPDGFLDTPHVQEVLNKMDPPVSAEWLQSQLDHKIASVTVTARKPEEQQCCPG